MMLNPSIGARAQCWYRASLRPVAKLHGKVGTITATSKGPGPRNHQIEIEGVPYIVPCGNLRRPA